MALFTCPICGEKVSTLAKFCPHCFEIVNTKNVELEQELPQNLRDTQSDAYFGNTSGNLNNSGMAASYYGGHFICNGGKTHSFDLKYNHIESLSNEATSLNVIDRFLYFRTSRGIYEYDLVHKVILQIFAGYSKRLCVTQDYIFFICRDDNDALYRMKRNGSVIKRIESRKVYSYCLSEDYIFYTLTNGTTYRIDMDDLSSKKEIMNKGAVELCADATSLFFSSVSCDRRIFSSDFDGNHIKKINDEPSYCLNIYGQYIFYSNDEKYGTLCRIDRLGNNRKELNEEYSETINVLDGRYIIASKNHSDNPDWAIMDFDGKNVTPLSKFMFIGNGR